MSLRLAGADRARETGPAKPFWRAIATSTSSEAPCLSDASLVVDRQIDRRRADDERDRV